MYETQGWGCGSDSHDVWNRNNTRKSFIGHKNRVNVGEIEDEWMKSKTWPVHAGKGDGVASCNAAIRINIYHVVLPHSTRGIYSLFKRYIDLIGDPNRLLGPIYHANFT